MSGPNNILLTSASGNIGSHLVPLLLTQKPRPKLILPTTNPSKLKSSIQSETNAIVEEGTVKDPIWFQSLLTTHHVDTVFLCLTGTDELFTTMLCLDAISRVPTIKKVVYLSITGDFTSSTGFAETVATRGYPHLFAKVLVEQRLQHAKFDFDWTVLGPTTFFTNDYALKPNIVDQGEMHTLSRKGVNKASLSDIALAARNAMYDTQGTWSRKKIMLGSKKGYTGDELVSIWSTAMGKTIKAEFATEEGMEAFEREFRAMVPTDSGKAMARDLRLVFEFLMSDGIEMSGEEYEEVSRLVGRSFVWPSEQLGGNRPTVTTCSCLL